MKAGISTACFVGSSETEKALLEIAGLGAACAEVSLGTFYEYRPEFAKKYATNAGGAEVCSVRVSPFNFEPQLFSPSRRIRGDGFYWLEQVMRSAGFFGCKNYVLNGYVLNNGKCKVKDTAAYMREISGFCARYGVQLCLKNNKDAIFESPSDFCEIIKLCPGLSGVLDLREAERSGYVADEYLAHMAGAIVQVNVSCADVDEKILKSFIRKLKSLNFDGNVVITGAAASSDLKMSFERLKEIIL